MLTLCSVSYRNVSRTTTPFTRIELSAIVHRASSSPRAQTRRTCPIFEGQQHFLRQRTKRWASKRNDGLVRPSIGEALANDAFGELFGALAIVHAKRGAVVIAEVKFRQ